MFDWEIEAKDSTNRTGTMTGSGTTRTLTLTDPVVPGTVEVTAGTVTADDDGDGTLSGTGVTAASSTINYVSGELSVTFGTAPSAQPTVAYKSFDDLEARDVRDIGNTPTSLRVRNNIEGGTGDMENGVIVQVSENREDWATLYSNVVPAQAVSDSFLTSVRFARVYAANKCRMFGGSINLQ